MTAQCKIAIEHAPWRNPLDGTENGQPWKTAMGVEVSGTATDLVALANAVKAGNLADVLRDRPPLPPAVAHDFESALRKAARLGVSRSGSSQQEIDGAARNLPGRVEVGLSWTITPTADAPHAPAPVSESAPAS